MTARAADCKHFNVIVPPTFSKSDLILIILSEKRHVL
jgi:hypothetical protein